MWDCTKSPFSSKCKHVREEQSNPTNFYEVSVGFCNNFQLVILVASSGLCLMFIPINRTYLILFKEWANKLFTVRTNILLIALSWQLSLLLLSSSVTVAWSQIKLDHVTHHGGKDGGSSLITLNDIIFKISFIKMCISVIMDYTSLCIKTKDDKTKTPEYLFKLDAVFDLCDLTFVLCYKIVQEVHQFIYICWLFYSKYKTKQNIICLLLHDIWIMGPYIEQK